MSEADDFKTAVLKHKNGLFDEAEAEYLNLLEILSTQLSVHRNLGMLLVQTDRAGDAWTYDKAAYSVFKDDFQFRKAFSQSAIAVKRSDRAISALERAVNLEPDDFDLKRVLSRLCVSQREFSRAIPQLLYIASQSDRALAADFILLADAYRALDQIEEAAQYYSDALSKNERDMETRLKLIGCSEFLGHLDETETHLNIILSHDETHREGLFWKGSLLARRHQPIEALGM